MIDIRKRRRCRQTNYMFMLSLLVNLFIVGSVQNTAVAQKKEESVNEEKQADDSKQHDKLYFKIILQIYGLTF